MDNDDDFPKMGRDIQKWSELDPLLPKVNLDIELFRRNNVSIASLVVLSGLLNEDHQHQQRYLSILTPDHFDPKSFERYLFEKIAAYLRARKNVPVSELEKWVTEYHLEIWGESPPNERMFFGNNWNLRLMLSFDPTEEQIDQAIELRNMKKEHIEKYGY
ncbi:MAG: hypothetical protein P4L50_07605 [Anaerolineaceae bacterium]|nr:hypothetical protein [Anaerolineaceae bacterium]